MKNLLHAKLLKNPLESLVRHQRHDALSSTLNVCQDTSNSGGSSAHLEMSDAAPKQTKKALNPSKLLTRGGVLLVIALDAHCINLYPCSVRMATGDHFCKRVAGSRRATQVRIWGPIQEQQDLNAATISV